MDEYGLADLDHPVDPFSQFDDHIYDNCRTCGLACHSDGKRHGPDGDFTGCDECGMMISDDHEGMVNTDHASSCSLHPDNTV